MATTRTIRADQAGRVLVHTKTTAVSVDVKVEPGRLFAEIILSTDDDSGPSTDIVNGSDLDASGQEITVDVTRAEQAGGGTYGNNVFQGNVTVGMQINYGRGVFISGDYLGGGRQQAAAQRRSPVTLTVYLPPGSGVNARSTSGNLHVTGALTAVKFRGTTATVTIGETARADISFTTGDITIGNLTEHGDLKVTTGQITVNGPTGATAKANVITGTIVHSGGIRVRGSVLTGRVIAL